MYSCCAVRHECSWHIMYFYSNLTFWIPGRTCWTIVLLFGDPVGPTGPVPHPLVVPSTTAFTTVELDGVPCNAALASSPHRIGARPVR